MIRLHIVRHGQTEWNAIRRVQGQQNSELNATGREQAAKVREALRDIDFKAIYASPLVRTQQTAEIICRDRSQEIRYLDGLKEMGLGEWETLMWDEVPAQWPEHHAMYTQQPHLFEMPGAETAQQVMDRGAVAINTIHSQVPDGDVLVVSHGVLIKTLVLKYALKPLQMLWDEPKMNNCCRSVLQLDKNAVASWLSVADHPIEKIQWDI